MPKIFPIKYKGDFVGDRGKAARIMRLAWRIEQHRFTVERTEVRHRRSLGKGEVDLVPELLDQMENFDGTLNLLPRDDAVDTAAMPTFVIKPKGNYRHSGPDVHRGQTCLELLEQGIQRIPGTTIPCVAGLNPSELTPKALAVLDKARYREREERRNRRAPRMRIGRVGRSLRSARYGSRSA